MLAEACADCSGRRKSTTAITRVPCNMCFDIVFMLVRRTDLATQHMIVSTTIIAKYLSGLPKIGADCAVETVGLSDLLCPGSIDISHEHAF